MNRRGKSFANPLEMLIGIALLCFLAIGTLPAFGQGQSTGAVSGTVTDKSQAVVPGATITLTNLATGASRTTKSNDSGRYFFPFVGPGTYDIKVVKQGFKSLEIKNQAVRVGMQLNANAVLEVGEVSTTVTVTSNPSAELQTLNATVGSTLSGATITNLPNSTRDAATLAVLQPGQNIIGNTGGVQSDQNTFQVDGGFATDDMSGDNNEYLASFAGDTTGGTGSYHAFNQSIGGGYSQAPSAVIPMPVSTVQEFKISTSNQTANFSGGAGSQIQVATKRGTDAFHGTAYEYYLDNNFAGANTWDNNSTGFKQPGSHFSRFGVNAGGKIPHSNYLGGSWFIFGGYEGFRFPKGQSFERSFPTASLRAGLIYENGDVVNLNPTNSMVPVVIKGAALPMPAGGWPANTGYNVNTGTVDPCPGGACDPLNLGLNPVIANLWNTYLPMPNDCTHGDGVNYCGYKGSISTPQSSNFGVGRIDHDFSKNWHFNATYHYYHLQNTVADQWDIGGFFPGDTKGQYSAIRQKPQNPWLMTLGVTTEISPTLTNDFHFSYTRNWWAYASPSGVPNVAGYPAALEIGGENSGSDGLNTPIFGPYNTNNQQTRTRIWNGHDYMWRDDMSWVKGNNLFQFGFMYLRQSLTHIRNDNGETINTYQQYLIGEGMPTSLSSVNIDLGQYIPSAIQTINKGNQSTYENLYSMVLGMISETQSLYTRGLGSQLTGLPLAPRTSCAIPGVPATSACISSPSLANNSIIPTYYGYFTDSWHVKPTISLNLGISYAVEMPPYETTGGVQSVMVDQNGNLFDAAQYFSKVKQSALQGIAYAPLIGFEAVRNVAGHSNYPYNPFYGGISPRIGIAWSFRPDTVLRAGYARIYGRINGVDPVLVPMLTPGLMQPATCTGPTFNDTCGTAGSPTTPLTGFRVGVNGVNAPLPQPSASLPEPWYPGSNDVATGAGETIDPNFKPNESDEFTVSIQHQFGSKILVETGYIGRWLNNELNYYSLTAVPYMMTVGGETFAQAWKNVMVATNYGTNLSTIPVEPFFEGALGGPTSAYCSGFANCTTAFVNNSQGLMNVSDPFDAWAAVSNAGDWVFGRSFTSDPIAATCTNGITLGCDGQTPSLLTTISNGYGNYNAGYLQLTTTDWHGLTMKSNFSFSRALGTGNATQATSSYATLDPWNLHNSYGPQIYDETFVFNLFMNYAEPFYANQQGWKGRLLGGWSIAPLFVAGSGFPIQVGTANFNCGTFGQCNTAYTFSLENGIITQNLNYNNTQKHASGTVCGNVGAGYNVFSNPDASCPQNAGIFGDPVRNPILGFDHQNGGGGVLRGLPFWNLDVGVTKKVNINERASASVYFDFLNVLNHMQPADPCFNIYDTSSWGVLGCGGDLQANTPRRLQMGISFDW
jgi:hypothetical protein